MIRQVPKPIIGNPTKRGDFTVQYDANTPCKRESSVRLKSPRRHTRDRLPIPEDDMKEAWIQLGELKAREEAWEMWKSVSGYEGTLQENEHWFSDGRLSGERIVRKEAEQGMRSTLDSAHPELSKHQRKRTQRKVRREIIVDSGASRHMIGRKQLHTTEAMTIRKLSRPFAVQTANGILTCDSEAQIYIHDLGIWVWAQLSFRTPAFGTLSFRKCMSLEP